MGLRLLTPQKSARKLNAQDGKTVPCSLALTKNSLDECSIPFVSFPCSLFPCFNQDIVLFQQTLPND